MSCQVDNVDVSDEVKQLVADIARKNNFNETYTVKYSPGSQVGDGFTTKTYTVDISDSERSVGLFLKCALNLNNIVSVASIIYGIETYFYKTIYPAYTDFWKSKGIKDGFRNAPASYGYCETKGSEILALEDLRKKRFTLFDRFTYMNDEHLTLTLRTFAKFHAISFAMKDQQKDLHDEFCESCPPIMLQDDTLLKMSFNTIKNFVEKLDSTKDEDILKRCADLPSKVYNGTKDVYNRFSDFSILTKGDCWVNNMMVLYENDDREHPKDVMLIDWQCMTRASPVLDFQSLFYSVASKKTVDNYKHYMDVYYDELSNRIKELGSDPDVMYPRHVFDKEWIDCSLFALGTSLGLIKMMLSQKEDAPNIEKAVDKEEIANIFSNVKHDEATFLIRAKYIIRHMIEIGVL